jgi:hypothetical protein
MTAEAGYPIAAEATDRDLYRLAVVFAASRRMRSIGSKHPRVIELGMTFEATEASQLLVSLAATFRSHLDTGTAFMGGVHSKDTVGALWPDVTKRRHRIPLTFREACNKIIHADLVDLWPLDRRNGRGALRSSVRLAGTKGRLEWRTDVEVFRFVEAATWLG